MPNKITSLIKKVLHLDQRASARGPRTGRGSHPPRGPGWSRAGEPRNREGAAPRNPGITRGAAQRSLGVLGWSPGVRGGTQGTRMEPRLGAREPGWSQQLRLGQQQLKHVSARSAPPSPPGHPGPLCVYNLPPGKSAGPSRAGRWRDQKGLCCTGRGGSVCFVGWIWVPSPREGRLVPNRPAPGLPLSRGGLDPWRVSPHFLPRPGRPLLPASPPKLPASLLHPRHPCSDPESLQEAGRSLRGEKGPREWKEEAAAATRCKKYREPPRAPRPFPFRVRTHPTSSRSPAGSSGTHRWTSR